MGAGGDQPRDRLMLSRLQAWMLAGCVVLVATGLLALRFWPEPSGLRPAALVSDRTERDPTRPLPVLHHTPLPDRYFQLTIKGNGALQRPRGVEPAGGEVELKYAHQKSVDGILLTFYSAGMKTFENGRLQYGFQFDRDKLVEQSGGKTSTHGFEEVTPEQQAKLKAAFATNYCRILLDGNQNETGREILSPLGSSMINEGLLEATRLVHGPFCPGLNSWTAMKRIPITPGMVLECLVSYKKVAGAENRIELSGSAAKAEVKGATRDILLKNISCDLSGSEVFDGNSWEYTSADLKLTYSFEVFEQAVSSGILKGELVVSLTQVIRQ
jgi:hypothetical protein